jgi:polyhydroxyalkanoate synthesis regulator phasin
MKRRKGAVRKATSRAGARGIRKAWEAGLEGLTAAEKQLEKQARRFIRHNKLNAKDARVLLDNVSARLAAGRKRASRELDAKFLLLQGRLKKERRTLFRALDDAVRGALAALNIPNRREVANLTRRVEELSAKIDAFRRRSPRGSRPLRHTARAA